MHLLVLLLRVGRNCCDKTLQTIAERLIVRVSIELEAFEVRRDRVIAAKLC